jgi:hypothetical protein
MQGGTRRICHQLGAELLAREQAAVEDLADRVADVLDLAGGDAVVALPRRRGPRMQRPHRGDDVRELLGGQ